ncbi:MAG: hypothetical protein ACE5JB_08720 [bacterium]
MKENGRKFTAVFLSCIFLILSVAAEFSHHHNGFQNGQPTITKSDFEFDEIKTNQKHSFICLACLYGLNQLAPALSFQTLKPNQESLFTTFKDSTFYFVFLTTHFYLRAPPIQFS